MTKMINEVKNFVSLVFSLVKKVLMLALVLTFVMCSMYVALFGLDKNIGKNLSKLTENVKTEISMDILGQDAVDFISERTVLRENNKVLVAQCEVLDGHIFLVKTLYGESFLVQLPVASKEGSRTKVLDIFQKVEMPVVILKRKMDNYWIGDFHFVYNGTETTLTSLLEEEGLLINTDCDSKN